MGNDQSKNGGGRSSANKDPSSSVTTSIWNNNKTDSKNSSPSDPGESQLATFEKRLLKHARCTVQIHDMRIPHRPGETFHFAECMIEILSAC